MKIKFSINFPFIRGFSLNDWEKSVTKFSTNSKLTEKLNVLHKKLAVNYSIRSKIVKALVSIETQ